MSGVASSPTTKRRPLIGRSGSAGSTTAFWTNNITIGSGNRLKTVIVCCGPIGRAMTRTPFGNLFLPTRCGCSYSITTTPAQSLGGRPITTFGSIRAVWCRLTGGHRSVPLGRWLMPKPVAVTPIEYQRASAAVYRNGIGWVLRAKWCGLLHTPMDCLGRRRQSKERYLNGLKRTMTISPHPKVTFGNLWSSAFRAATGTSD